MSPKPPSVADNEDFIFLLTAARENADMRRRLLAILSQTPFNRTSILNTFIDEMRLKRAPPELIRAVACLLDHKIAQKAARMLTDAEYDESL